MKHVKILSIFLTLLSVNAYCQNSDKSKPTSYTIAYGSNESGHSGTYLTDSEAKSKIKITNRGGGYLAWSTDGKRLAIKKEEIMKTTKLLILTCAISLNTVFAQEKIENDANHPILEGPYLGQKPPGLTPEVFAPGILSTKHRDGGISFTPDMKEFYFSRKDLKTGKWWLVVFRSENNRWRESVVGPRVGRPTLAPDGKVMHLGNKYMERTETGWSAVKSLGPLFNREDWGIMRLSASTKGTYVFDDYKSNDVLRISTLKDGKREEPRLLSKEINTGKWTAHPFIAPDESYIIWDSENDGGYGEVDLYISFRQQDGSWGTAINMGDKINTSEGEAGGYVSPDGKYFFFNRGGIFWVDAKIIETLRPK